jgi:hypothetical protein
MFWIIAVGAIIAVLGVFEWRSWKKPLPGRLRQDWSVNNSKETGRAITGGHTFDTRHD